MHLLLLSFVALALGPLLVVLARRHAWSTIAVDAFCVVSISGFALLHLLPECVQQAGWLALPLALAGFLAPMLAERGLHRDNPHLRSIVLFLAVLFMAAHATLDGFFLADGAHQHHEHAPGAEHDHGTTAWAIILHRIPEGFGIWWIVPRTLGLRAAILVTLVSVGTTVFGYFLGESVLSATSQRGLALLQALLAGSLLHVVLHAHVPAPRDQGRWHFASVGGAAAAVLVLNFVIHDHFPGSDADAPARVFVRLAAESAPALLIAYVLVGLCHAFVPAGWLQRMTRGNPFTQALRGVAVGLPLPVCSCGVLPIYRELVRQKASLAAALAFLVATPELEIAAVLLTWQLMGGEIALTRVAMAALLALGVGLLVGSLAGSGRPTDGEPAGSLPESPRGPIGRRLLEALRFGYGPAVDNTATWILMGLLLSAMLVPYVDPEWLAALPAGLDVPTAALVGLPLYVCATGSTPLAAILLAKGLSPGAVLALLLTGPATNLTTFGVLGRLHGRRIAILFAAAMWLGAVLLGYAVNWLLPAAVAEPAAAAVGHDHAREPLELLLLAVLGAVFLLSLLRQGVRPFLERLFESPANVGHEHAAACCADGDHAHGHDHAAAIRPPGPLAAGKASSHGRLPAPDPAGPVADRDR